MKRLKKILVAFDGSESGIKVLDTAKKFARDNDAQLTVVYVHGSPLEYPINIGTTQTGEEFIYQYMGHDVGPNNTPVASGVVPSQQMVTIVEEEIPNQVMATAKAQLADLATVTFVKLVGKAAEKIVEYTETNDMDLIIIGNRGMGAIKKFVMGSVSQKVANDSDCSVFIVK